MPRAYSEDLRDPGIDAVVRGGESGRSASRRFSVSEALALRWVQRYDRARDRRCLRYREPSAIEGEARLTGYWR